MRIIRSLGALSAIPQAIIRPATTFIATLLVLGPTAGSANDFCPDVYQAGTLGLNFNAGSMHVSKMNFGSKKYDGLIISSIF